MSNKVQKVNNQATQKSSYRWKVYEAVFSQCKLRQVITCSVCKYTGNKTSFRTTESECIFGGGKLVRYLCPICGLIFGPLKLLYLPQPLLSFEYSRLYRKYHESDNTKNEIRTFHNLKPKKNGVYLNYGSGLWSNSIKQLRHEGWTVFGYEPYASNEHSDHIFSSRKEIYGMRFDGIYSNNVIEHIRNPIAEFTFMKSMLKNKRSVMAHATPCYEYKYDYSVFHVHFYTDKSKYVLADRVGLKITNHHTDVNSEYICYTYMHK